MEVGGERHLMRWWTHVLHKGPTLTMAIMLPESRFDAPLRGVLRNTIYTTLAVMLASVLFSLFVASRLVRPLQSLSDWATRRLRMTGRPRHPSPARSVNCARWPMRWAIWRAICRSMHKTWKPWLRSAPRSWRVLSLPSSRRSSINAISLPCFRMRCVRRWR